MPGRGSTPEKGNQRARSHGAYAKLAPERLDVKAREVYDAIASRKGRRPARP